MRERIESFEGCEEMVGKGENVYESVEKDEREGGKEAFDEAVEIGEAVNQ